MFYVINTFGGKQRCPERELKIQSNSNEKNQAIYYVKNLPYQWKIYSSFKMQINILNIVSLFPQFFVVMLH